MASLKFPLEILAVFVIISVILLPIAHAQSSSPAPAPTSDGTIYLNESTISNLDLWSCFTKKMIVDICFLISGCGRNIDRSGDSVCSNDAGFGVDLFHSLNLMNPSTTMVLFPSVCVLFL
ncbi:unnamed protein product [Brassica oleracea var. botrytis]|uniref:(rape) hypothetical protein n=1 Tax=Brassica napus TaxID=3708 RepID=A0A816I9S3_BRANA|nr:unnamed protein product [Brassica napus]